VTNAIRSLQLHGLRDLPALSQVVVDLQAALSRDVSTLGDIATRVSRDQALAAKTLRLANCSMFGVARRVVTIRDAIAFLGLRSVSTLLTAAAISDAFSRVDSRAFENRQYWRHSIGAAICAREIAGLLNLDRDAAFTAGLLHDLGRLALASQAPAVFDEVAAMRTSRDCLLIEAEREILGTDHAELGASVASRWHFAAPIAEAVRLHHRPPAALRPMLVDVVHVADCIVHALDVAGDPMEVVPPMDVAAWNRLALTPGQCQAVFERTKAEVIELCEALGA
jgi:putative nucleotidyltransferase with HDIG domain